MNKTLSAAGNAAGSILTRVKLGMHIELIIMYTNTQFHLADTFCLRDMGKTKSKKIQNMRCQNGCREKAADIFENFIWKYQPTPMALSCVKVS